MKDEIYKIKKIELGELEQTSPLDKWFYEMVQKKEEELTLLDISRLLRQEIYLDIALPLAWRKLLENPFCGEMYEGQLLELLIRTLIKNPKEKQNDFYELLVKEVIHKTEAHEWENDDEKNEYLKMINKLEKILK